MALMFFIGLSVGLLFSLPIGFVLQWFYSSKILPKKKEIEQIRAGKVPDSVLPKELRSPNILNFGNYKKRGFRMDPLEFADRQEAITEYFYKNPRKKEEWERLKEEYE